MPLIILGTAFLISISTLGPGLIFYTGLAGLGLGVLIGAIIAFSFS